MNLYANRSTLENFTIRIIVWTAVIGRWFFDDRRSICIFHGNWRRWCGRFPKQEIRANGDQGNTHYEYEYDHGSSCHMDIVPHTKPLAGPCVHYLDMAPTVYQLWEANER